MMSVWGNLWASVRLNRENSRAWWRQKWWCGNYVMSKELLECREKAKHKIPLHVASRGHCLWLWLIVYRKKRFFAIFMAREDLFASPLVRGGDGNLIIRWWNSNPVSLDIIICEEDWERGERNLSIYSDDATLSNSGKEFLSRANCWELWVRDNENLSM